jgi:uncharacterized repeat protein (TIGR01451 family)
MSPTIRDGEMVYVKPASEARLRRGDIVLVKSDYGFRLHRLVRADLRRNVFITRGDCGQQNDPAVRHDQILGVAVAKDVLVGKKILRANFRGIPGAFLQFAAQAQSIAGKFARTTGLSRLVSAAARLTSSRPRRERSQKLDSQKLERSSKLFGFLALFFMLLAVPCARAQVALDAATSTDAEETGNATRTLTFAHTTTATGTNLLMLVGVSINITNATTTAVSSVKYNGATLFLLGAHNDAGNTRRVEMWYMQAPATGNHNVAVAVNIPAAATVGVSAGAVTFTGVDQTVPLGSFISADGAAAAYSQLYVPSVVNGMILDTLAIGGPETITIPGPQASEWNLSTANGFGQHNDPPDVTGSGSTRTGAPDVPLSETFSANSNWSEGAVSINPTAADIGVTTSVGSAVFLGSNTTYTINVFNNGTSAANTVKLTDTLASGMTLVSATPSTGTCVTTANPIVCTIGNMASGATATVTVVETAAAAGSYSNTAVVSDSGTPPDPNTGNNTYVAVATVQSAACATVAQAAPGTGLTGTLNTYYPGTASVAAGATSIPIGAATGAGSGIAAGNLLLIIQMQDASLNLSNNVDYGNGDTGQGFTALNSAGDYEFVTAKSAVGTGGGTVTITGAGSGGGTVFAYHSSAVSATAGQSTYQVIVVPQYTTASFSSTSPPTALAWNGSTGGVLAIDTSNTLTLNGATVSVNGLGFRGGAGLQLSGVPNPAPPTLPANTDFQQTAPSTYSAAADGEAGWDAPKGEGIAGTPAWVEYNDTFLATGTGYPSGAFGTFNVTSVANAAGGDTVYTGTFTGGAGNTLSGYIFVIDGFANAANNGRFISTASTTTTLTLNNAAGVAQTATATANLDGSMARGAPGNAGGGATDGDPGTASMGGNDENAGGGGGGNGGAGGFGGDSWNNNLSVGGEGGAAFPATINRIALGGGGGGGSRNNSNGDNQASGGSTGGGIIIIRTYALSGAATLTANGVNAYNGTSNDAGGGGGAGGSIVVLSANGGEGGLTLQANGGNGGDAWMTEPYTLGNRHGPGGGGGGGVLLVSGTPASASVTGGTDGTTENPGVTYGSTSGAAGFSITDESITQTSGTQSGAECTPDMTLAKNSSGVFTRGLTATYTIPVSNVSSYGPSSGTVTVNDTLPIGLMPTAASGTGWSCSVASQTVSCTDSTALTAGSTYPSITVTANVLQTAPSTVTNTATVAGGGEVNLANDTATNVAAVVSSADLAVTDTAAPNPVAAGSNITYTQVVTNNGPSAADTATLVQAVPTGATFVSISAPAGWTCTNPGVGNTGNVVCSILSMTGSTAATFSMVVKVPAGTTSGTVITDTATVSSSVSDPNSANNTASASTVVGTTTQAEMTVTNVASPNPVAAGSNITYTQTATNIGAAAATNPTLTENTPANTTFQSISAPTGTTCTTPAVGGTGAISCTAPSAPAGSSGTVVLIVQVVGATTAGTIITDTATVNATNQGLGSNSAVATDVVASSSQVDLTLTTIGTPLTVFAGNNISYTETVTNGGPSAATGVSLTESIPNTTVVSASAPAGWTCTTTSTTVTCTDPSLASGASVNIPVVVSVAASDTTTPITATSSLSATNAATTSNMFNTPVIAACDLAVTNTGTPSPVAAGGVITYTQVVTNTGPSNCSTATFTEPFPTNTTFTSLTPVPTGWTCTTTGIISCSNPTVAPGSTSTFTVKVTVAAGAAAGTLITDTATVATTTRNTNSANNSASVVIPVAGATQADLTVINSGSPNPVNAGQNVTYTQSVTNSGPAGATTVVLTETLPAGATFVSLASSAGTCTTAAPYTCSIGSLALNATATVNFVVTASATATPGSTITNTATVTSGSSNPNPVNYASATVYVAGSAALSITNSASPVPVIAGSNITYAQVVTNAGPSAATNAIFTETTPPNTTFVQLTPIPSGWSCILPAVGAAGTITCTDPSFAVGTASFPVVVKVAAGTAAGTAVNDTATINSSTNDPNSANNSATANDVVALSTQADLIATNSAAPTSVAAGSNITFTQSVTNNGPSAATAPTFTQTTPPNTTFQSITPPTTGWTCITPAVGAAGTITCTGSSSLAINATANFTLVLQVNSGTPSGTNIAETVLAGASNIVPGLTSNSATANVVVANANSADMAIVSDGDPLTYSLAVTNNGPASATDVTVTDPLPSQVTFLSVTSTVGTCSQADGTVTCLLGTMADAATATITILTLPITEGTATNTATVSADQTDPVPGNNSSTQTEYITYPTSIRLRSFVVRIGKDKTGASRTFLLWKTGGEAHNLGFNIYREQNGGRVRLNSSLIAGSALLMSGSSLKHSAKTYAWVDSTPIDSTPIDSSPASGSGSYWLEDVDINGTRIMHGPVTAESAASSQSAAEAIPATSPMLNQLNQSQPAAARNEMSHPVENLPQDLVPTPAQRQKQFELAANPAVKIYVKHAGWQSVSQPQLISAGLDPNVDPALLHLYAEAIEQPIRITGATAGPGGFGPQATLQFYGTAIDTPYSGTRVYWLVTGEAPGQRIPLLPLSTGPNQPPTSFPFTVELTQHTTYFGSLITSNGNNFFGAFISSTPTDQTLQIPHLDPNATAAPILEVILQGVILGFPHDVAVSLNGTSLGDITFTGQAKGKFRATLPPGVLQEGANTVTLTAQNGEFDTSVVQTIHIIYPHSYIADSDSLQFIGRPGDELKVTGFTTAPVAVLDITDPERPVELTPQISSNSGQTQYALEVQVPWSNIAGSVSATPWHTLLALAADRVASVAGINANHPSQWHRAQSGSEIVMISHQPFTDALAPLVQAHHAAGQSVAVVRVDDLYDEYAFGQHSPFAIKDFLYAATHVWHTAPHYLLLNGGASLDPRNYLGFGHLDFVPTKIVPTSMLMTASDDWFSDFTNTGAATIATGRFPVSTQQEAELVAGRVAAYEGQSTNGPWTSQALMVADVNDTENFTQDSQIVQAQLPKAMQPTDVFASTVGIPTAQQDIISSINSGQLLVNYAGHGSEDEWSGDDLFNNTAASSLTNGSSLPVFLIMDCLNGFFQGVPQDSLAVALMLAPNGGAVAVLASSGLNLPAPQTQLNKLIVQNALHAPYPALGDAILNAKSAINDPGVRKTYNLMGDPAMQIKSPATTAAH